MPKKRTTIFVAILSVLFISIFLVIFTGGPKTASPTTTATQGEISVKVTAIGNIVSAKTAAVKSPVSGIVAQFFHEEGDQVKKGDALLVVKPQPTPKDYATAQQKVATDLVNEKSGLANVKRYESLLRQNAISKNDQEYIKAITDYKNARLQTELDQKILALLAEGKISSQDKDINNIIYSPIDGFVVERVVNIGDPVIPQTDYQAGNVLFTVADMQSLIFKGQVSEADAAKLHLGVQAAIKLAALPEVTLSGTLSQLGLQSTQLATPSPSATTATANTSTPNNSPFNVGYKVEISRLAVPSGIQLRAGYSATAEIVIATVKDVLLIPERILQSEKDKPYVWRFNPKGPPTKQFVGLGLSDGVNVQILTGLKTGDPLLEIPPDDLKTTTAAH